MQHVTPQTWKDPPPESIGTSIKAFLCQMRGPTWIDITGADTSRTRVLVTLLHGNEPSGVKALFHWLRDPLRAIPRTNMSIFVCSVEAALTEPEFSHRYLPGLPDMNRCFRPPYDSPCGYIARQVLRRITALKPEAVVDMHNTSGAGPDFAVTTRLDPLYINLAQQFSSRLILTELHLGALMEAPVGCPIITLECGGIFDLSADQKAVTALEILSRSNNLFLAPPGPEIDLYRHPLRLEIKDGVSLTYGEQAEPGYDVTLAFDIEKHNFGITGPGEPLGWIPHDGLDYFTAINDQGLDIKHDLFQVIDGVLHVRLPLRLFMITPRPEIAIKDCLFYLVKATP
ncbi:succinylglutamate desuccinylase/aspartoacylase domain-containing protein [Paremcibacter congregatus]|uniref:succinylglutamate desuccinylase/aspartoacylase domain-containing protein n=1 Tax=Paremcibacter congregatus TaxID=2043170 RepID=UPI0030EB3509|tara:strand:+ start:9911 stop:10936 length:1026 start_codon:yes stop_codon:yes gene_type:complete